MPPPRQNPSASGKPASDATSAQSSTPASGELPLLPSNAQHGCLYYITEGGEYKELKGTALQYFSRDPTTNIDAQKSDDGLSGFVYCGSRESANPEVEKILSAGEKMSIPIFQGTEDKEVRPFPEDPPVDQENNPDRVNLQTQRTSSPRGKSSRTAKGETPANSQQTQSGFNATKLHFTSDGERIQMNDSALGLALNGSNPFSGMTEINYEGPEADIRSNPKVSKFIDDAKTAGVNVTFSSPASADADAAQTSAPGGKEAPLPDNDPTRFKAFRPSTNNASAGSDLGMPPPRQNPSASGKPASDATSAQSSTPKAQTAPSNSHQTQSGFNAKKLHLISNGARTKMNDRILAIMLNNPETFSGLTELCYDGPEADVRSNPEASKLIDAAKAANIKVTFQSPTSADADAAQTPAPEGAPDDDPTRFKAFRPSTNNAPAGPDPGMPPPRQNPSAPGKPASDATSAQSPAPATGELPPPPSNAKRGDLYQLKDGQWIELNIDSTKDAKTIQKTLADTPGTSLIYYGGATDSSYKSQLIFSLVPCPNVKIEYLTLPDAEDDGDGDDIGDKTLYEDNISQSENEKTANATQTTAVLEPKNVEDANSSSTKKLDDTKTETHTLGLIGKIGKFAEAHPILFGIFTFGFGTLGMAIANAVSSRGDGDSSDSVPDEKGELQFSVGVGSEDLTDFNSVVDSEETDIGKPGDGGNDSQNTTGELL
jgi:hypothetical protein